MNIQKEQSIDRTKIMETVEHLHDLEDDLRLLRSIEDCKHGRTVPAEVVMQELRQMVGLPAKL